MQPSFPHPGKKNYSFELYFLPDSQAALKAALSRWCAPLDQDRILSLQPGHITQASIVLNTDAANNFNIEFRLESSTLSQSPTPLALCLCLYPPPQVLDKLQNQSQELHQLFVTLLESCNGLAGVLDYGNGAMETFWLPT